MTTLDSRWVPLVQGQDYKPMLSGMSEQRNETNLQLLSAIFGRKDKDPELTLSKTVDDKNTIFGGILELKVDRTEQDSTKRKPFASHQSPETEVCHRFKTHVLIFGKLYLTAIAASTISVRRWQ